MNRQAKQECYYTLGWKGLPGTNALANGTAHLKNVSNCLNTNIYSYLETPGGQTSNLYLNVVHIFNTSVN
jgi:hypothetical protein